MIPASPPCPPSTLPTALPSTLFGSDAAEPGTAWRWSA